MCSTSNFFSLLDPTQYSRFLCWSESRYPTPREVENRHMENFVDEVNRETAGRRRRRGPALYTSDGG